LSVVTARKMTKNVFNTISHVSHRGPPSVLKDRDYDHEIRLVDHTSLASRSQSAEPSRSEDDSLTRDTTGTTRHSSDRGRRRSIVKREVERKRWSKKWTEDRPGQRAGHIVDPSPPSASLEVTPRMSAGVEVVVTGAGSEDSSSSREGRSKSKAAATTIVATKTASPTSDSAIDILYENQRGAFLCGIPLFAARALGALDAAPWTNIAFKPSPTQKRYAQVPDPSWEWAWDDWRVNHDPESTRQDEEGWEYSFMFSKRCSWHGPSWYNSFVRRRAWIRKRVRRDTRAAEEGYMLNADYFTIQSQRQRSLSPQSHTNAGSRAASSLRDEVEVLDREDIRDIGHLMKALKESRIDREKLEVVENFVQNGGGDLFYLGERMHDVMGMFIFQPSRRLLLAHLSTTVDEARAKLEAKGRGKDKQAALPEEVADVEEQAKRRIANLLQAVAAAEEEVKRLEF